MSTEVEEIRTEVPPRSGVLTATVGGPAHLRDLESSVQVLARKFPQLPVHEVRAIVHATYERIAAAARLRTHLVPLTVNRARAELERHLQQRRPAAGEPRP